MSPPIASWSKHGTSHLAAGAGANHHRQMREFIVRPQPEDPRLTRTVAGIDHEGRPVETAVVMERPLTLFLNRREIVTMMLQAWAGNVFATSLSQSGLGRL